MKTFVIGSTGFLGYYTVLELLKHGHEIDSLSLTPVPDQVPFPTEVGLTLADFNQLDDEDILNKLTGFDGLIFAAGGADDRSLPQKPAYAFFKKYNVDATQRLIRLARQAGVKRAVVFSSYFVHFARKWPELELAEKHPYIRSRLDQINAANEAAGGELVVNYLLLPYIFGGLCQEKCRFGNPWWTMLTIVFPVSSIQPEVPPWFRSTKLPVRRWRLWNAVKQKWNIRLYRTISAGSNSSAAFRSIWESLNPSSPCRIG